MKRLKYLAVLLAFSLTLSACGGSSAVITPSKPDDNTTSVSEETKTSQDNTQTSSSEEINSEPTVTQETEDIIEPVELSDIEVKYFTEYFNKSENNGFLLSVYSDAKDVNLNEVFYSGAGQNCDVSDEERQAYMDYYGWEEMYIGLIAVDKSYVEETVLNKTGYSYNRMTKPISWMYNEATQRYYNAVGDTNFIPRKVVSGYKAGEVYVLKVQEDFSQWYETENYYYKPALEVALTPNGDDYKFLSVRYYIDENLMEEYCYNLCVPFYGEVNLVTYAPRTEDSDITFALIKDYEYINSLWSGTNNHLDGMKFSKIMDIGFYDYNNDGFIDILMNIEYTKDDGNNTYILRVYSGSEYGYFSYRSQETEDCYACVGLDTTTKDIKAEIMYDCLSYSYSLESSDWKTELVNAIRTFDYNLSGDLLGGGYYCIFIDGDDIPEIVQVGDYPEIGTTIYTNHEGVVYETALERLYFTYNYKEGLICNSEGDGLFFFDRVYELRDGQFYLLGIGEYNYAESDETTTYYWNGEAVSETKYKTNLKSLYYTEYAAPGYVSNNFLSTDEIIRMLTVDVRKGFQ